MPPNIITTSTSTVMTRITVTITVTITGPFRRITTRVPPAPMKCWRRPSVRC
jgi:hypothetical protein